MRKTPRSPAACWAGVWIGCAPRVVVLVRGWPSTRGPLRSRRWPGIGCVRPPGCDPVVLVRAARARPVDHQGLDLHHPRRPARRRRAARLAGDQEARRTAQETIRADSRARWAKVGLALRRGLGAGLLVAFLAGVLALVDSQVGRADMWPWLATVYTVLGVAGVVGLWVLKAVPLGWLVAAVWEGRDRTPGASLAAPPGPGGRRLLDR